MNKKLYHINALNASKLFAIIAKDFRVPALVFLGILLYIALNVAKMELPAILVVLGVTALGSYGLMEETLTSLAKRQFALDYIAILAIVVALYTNEYLVASVIALMLSTGRTLEEYGVNQAKKNLTTLADRIPDTVLLWDGKKPDGQKKVGEVTVGEQIFIRKGEVIPLDGILVSKHGLTDESSLTGEPFEIEKIKDDPIRSGTINIGDAIVIKVTKTEENSTYHKIMDMVQSAQQEKAPLVRLADRYSTVFTLITFVIAGFAYFYSHSIESVLAVLVVATPCPLILATPIALIGGVNAAAKKRIIVKKLASIEALSRVKAVIFDKTGTITIGVPRVSKIEILDKKYNEKEVLAISQAIERNSLHPLAKAIVTHAQEKRVKILHAEVVEETIGTGIAGKVAGKKYTLSRLKEGEGMSISLSEGKKLVAIFSFEEQLKDESTDIIKKLLDRGYKLFIYTGDKKQAAEKVALQIDQRIVVRAELSPQDKQEGIKQLKKDGLSVAMVGDGINDAPALALADAGLVFSNEEQTAASEAADIVFLGGDFGSVSEILNISRRTIGIALQSILWGIGLSVIAMVFAAYGFIAPVFGALLQEVIDVAVILNALRASRYA